MTNETEEKTYNDDAENLGLLMKEPFYTIGAFKVDVKNKLLVFNDETEKLTPKDVQLLVLLSVNVNEVIDRKFILSSVWSEDTYNNSRSMEVYICKLRKLLRADPNIFIINIHGKGYKLLAPIAVN